MDRADKVKKYRKELKSIKSVRSVKSVKSGPRRAGTPVSGRRIGLLALGLFSAGVLFVLAGRFYQKEETAALDYVTGEEFAALMSFLSEDSLLEFWKKHPDAAVTQSRLRDFLQDIGLSGAVSASGGNGKLSRQTVMDYYEQILDYMDLSEAVRRDTVLVLETDGDICRTKDGAFTLSEGCFRPEDFYTYEAYLMDKTLIGIRGVSDKTIALKDVPAEPVSDSGLAFTYKKKEYQISCADAGGLSAGAHCTLCIKNGAVTKIKDIVNKEEDSRQQEAETVQALPQTVKVVLLNEGSVHYDQLYTACNGNFSLRKNGSTKKKKYAKTDVVNVKKLKIKKGSCVTIKPDKAGHKLYLANAQGKKISKGYYGSFVIYRDAEGYYIVNKVNVEKYLYSVVASEMPASFAKEALKAQAVCARSYVYQQMEAGDYSRFHAHIDDSTHYQVYNKLAVSAVNVQAVKETAGEVMYQNDKIISAYYYSTSCGYGSGMEIWNQEASAYPYLKAKSLHPSEGNKKFDLSKEKDFQTFIATSKDGFYDSESPYFRWTAQAEPSACLKELKQKILLRQQINPKNILFYSLSGKKARKVSSLKGFGGVEKIYCSKRSKSGAVLELTIDFEFGRVKVKMEYNIRSIIGCALEKITYADGSVNTSSRFLPSAYFSVSFNEKSRRYILKGGGNGHGMGMSQYAADSMAEDGWDYKQILEYFYDGAEVKKAGG